MAENFETAFTESVDKLTAFLTEKRVFMSDLISFECLKEEDKSYIEGCLTKRGIERIQERAQVTIKRIKEINTQKNFSLYLLNADKKLAYEVFPYLKEKNQKGFIRKERRGCAPKLLPGDTPNILWVVPCDRDYECVRKELRSTSPSSVVRNDFKFCALSIPTDDKEEDSGDRAQTFNDDPPLITSRTSISLACPLQKLGENSFDQLFDILTKFEPQPHIAVFTSVAPPTSAFTAMPGDVVVVTTSKPPRPVFAELELQTELWRLEGRLKDGLSVQKFEKQTKLERPTAPNLDAYAASVRFGSASGSDSPTAVVRSCDAVNFYSAAGSVEGLTFVAALSLGVVHAGKGSDDYWSDFAGVSSAAYMCHVINYLNKTA